MIAGCPSCKTKYRVARERMAPEGVRLRCSSCDSVFRVKPPQEAAPTPAASSSPTTLRERLVVVATPEASLRKSMSDALTSWGLDVLSSDDGVNAILTIQRELPQAVILDPTLPRMYGFEICELLKRNESLKSIGVVLMGAVHEPNRYHRPPSDLFGADAYVETPDLPEALHGILQGLGVSLSEPPSVPSPAVEPPAPEPVLQPPAPESVLQPPTPETEPEPVPEPPASPPLDLAPPSLELSPPEPDLEPPASPPEPPPLLDDFAPPATDAAPAPAEEPASFALDVAESVEQSSEPAASSDGFAEAERLARVIVSDVVLYNQEKFTAAIEAGNVQEVMEPDLADGRAHFKQRVSDEVAAQRDFITEELLRVARSRGMS